GGVRVRVRVGTDRSLTLTLTLTLPRRPKPPTLRHPHLVNLPILPDEEVLELPGVGVVEGERGDGGLEERRRRARAREAAGADARGRAPGGAVEGRGEHEAGLRRVGRIMLQAMLVRIGEVRAARVETRFVAAHAHEQPE